MDRAWGVPPLQYEYISFMGQIYERSVNNSPSIISLETLAIFSGYDIMDYYF